MIGRHFDDATVLRAGRASQAEIPLGECGAAARSLEAVHASVAAAGLGELAAVHRLTEGLARTGKVMRATLPTGFRTRRAAQDWLREVVDDARPGTRAGDGADGGHTVRRGGRVAALLLLVPGRRVAHLGVIAGEMALDARYVVLR